MILPNILVMVESSNVVMLMVLKCRRKRGVTGFRPPPGGPMAPTIWMSTRWIGDVSFRSYLKHHNTCCQWGGEGWVDVLCYAPWLVRNNSRTFPTNEKLNQDVIVTFRQHFPRFKPVAFNSFEFWLVHSSVWAYWLAQLQFPALYANCINLL